MKNSAFQNLFVLPMLKKTAAIAAGVCVMSISAFGKDAGARIKISNLSAIGGPMR